MRYWIGAEFWRVPGVSVGGATDRFLYVNILRKCEGYVICGTVVCKWINSFKFSLLLHTYCMERVMHTMLE